MAALWAKRRGFSVPWATAMMLTLPNLASGGYGPVEESVETGHAHAGLAGLDVFEKGRKAADELACGQVAGDRAKFL